MEPLREARSRRPRGLAAIRQSASAGLGATPVARLVRPTGIGYATAGFSHAGLIRLIDYPELPLRIAADDIVKAGATALVVKTTFTVNGVNVPAAYKRVRRKTWWKRLSDLVRQNRSLRTFRMGLVLEANGVATARPLAVIVPHRLDLFRDSYAATEWIDNAHTLHAFLRCLDDASEGDRRRLLAGAARSVGTLLGTMHAARISHRDLKPGNLLVREEAGAVDAFVIDLDGAARRRVLSRRVRVKNLARLARGLWGYSRITRSGLWRGLRAYLAECGDIDGRRLWRDVARRAGLARRTLTDRTPSPPALRGRGPG